MKTPVEGLPFWVGVVGIGVSGMTGLPDPKNHDMVGHPGATTIILQES